MLIFAVLPAPYAEQPAVVVSVAAIPARRRVPVQRVKVAVVNTRVLRRVVAAVVAVKKA